MNIKVLCLVCGGLYQEDTIQKHHKAHFKEGSQMNHRKRVVMDEMNCLLASDQVGRYAEL